MADYYYSSGYVISNTLIAGNNVYLYGVATSCTVSGNGNLYILSGGVAKSTFVNRNGNLNVAEGAMASFTNVLGVFSSAAHMTVSGGGVANSTTVLSSAYVYVNNGGVVNFTNVGSGSGYSAYGGNLYVHDSGVANSTFVYGNGYLNVYSGGMVNSTTLRGTMEVHHGGVASSSIIEGATMTVYSGGVTLSTVMSSGTINVNESGVLRETVLSGGRLNINYGGKVTGKLAISSGATISAALGSIVDFDLSAVEIGASPLINDLARIQGNPFFTITVDGEQTKSGVYRLAEGVAESFSTGFTVKNTTGLTLGNVSVNGTLVSGSWGIALFKTDGVLSVKVKNGDGEGLQVLSVSADITAPTNKTVMVTATYNDDTARTQYSLDNETWLTYTTEGVEMSTNGIIYFRCIDDLFNLVSPVASYTVTNIDRKAPKKPVVTADVTAPTNGDVTLTAEFSDDSVVKQYLTGTTWVEYPEDGVVMSSNGVLYFRSIDGVGNVSELTRYNVSNIDKTPPVQPGASADVVIPTSGSVTVTATYSDDSVVRQYSFDNETWLDYTTPVVVTANGPLYFRAIDAVGNVSDVTVFDVENILDPTEKVVAGDINGDGRADILMTVVEAGHGAEGATGAWLIQADQTPVWGDLSQREPGWEIFGTGNAFTVKNSADIYVKSADNVVGVWVTDNTGNVTGWETVGEFDAATRVLGIGDFNGDGKSDLLLRNTNGAVGCYLTSGDTTGWNYFQSVGDEWTIAAVGDLNGDGLSDMVLKHDAGFAGSWLTQADGTVTWANLGTLSEGYEIVGTGDFNGDFVADVLLKKGSYYGAWIVEDGGASAWMGLGDLGDGTVEEIADFDGDWIDDLRIRTAAGDLGAQLVKGEDNLEWKYYGSVGQEWSTGLAAI